MSLSPAPWKQALISHVQSLACPTFTLATAAISGGTVSPHVRTLIYRGFYGELPPNKHNPQPGNTGYSSDLITFTTDKRMEKFKDLGEIEGVSTSSSSPSAAAAAATTNNVEACFWIPSKENAMIGKQWRIRGRCFVLPRDIDTTSGGGETTTKKWLTERLRGKQGGKGEGFDFGKEYKAHFGNLSPVLRGSFRNPLPGAPKELGTGGLTPKSPIGDDELNQEVALDNFRVVVIEPTRVEYLDLEGPLKLIWVPVGGEAEKNEMLEKFGKVDGDWREVEVWP
ncbi:hypothetical protein AA313_de0210099 [Arthrobotrys entomopaga]|nr:hypothetical protein AA313_de0210099 [Arthrobotrys entomopaga]